MLVSLASGRRLVDCFAGRFRLFGRRSYSVLRGWRWLRNGPGSFHGRRRGDGRWGRWDRSRRLGKGLSRSHGRRRGDGRWGRCNRNRRILLHLRLGKIETRAQEYARNNAQAYYDEKRDAFRRECTPFRQCLPRCFQVHIGIMAQPSPSIYKGSCQLRSPARPLRAQNGSRKHQPSTSAQRHKSDFEGRSDRPDAIFSCG